MKWAISHLSVAISAKGYTVSNYTYSASEKGLAPSHIKEVEFETHDVLLPQKSPTFVNLGNFSILGYIFGKYFI